MSATTDVALPAAPDKRGWTWFESLFGVLMPIICFAVDLSFMSLSLLAPLAFWGVAFLGILAFILARFKAPFAIGEVILGMLWASAIVAVLIGLALVGLLGFLQVKGGVVLPLSFIFQARSSAEVFLFVLVYGVMILAWVPFFTAKAFYNRAAAVARRPGKRNTSLIALGALIVVTLPLAAHFVEYLWIKPHLAALRGDNLERALSSDHLDRRLNALRALNEYPFTLGRADGLACQIVMGGNRSANSESIIELKKREIDEPTMRELERMVGPDARSKCRRS